MQDWEIGVILYQSKPVLWCKKTNKLWKKTCLKGENESCIVIEI